MKKTLSLGLLLTTLVQGLKPIPLLVGLVLLLPGPLAKGADWNFQEVIIDDNPPQPARITDCEIVDINGDRKLDLWFSGRAIQGNERRFPWYKNIRSIRYWPRYTPFVGPSIGAAWGDVDGDGDPDLITARDRGKHPLVWMENPAKGGGNPEAGPWPAFEIHPDPPDPDEVHTTYIGSDSRVTPRLDMNGDRRLDVVIAAFKKTLWYMPGPADPKKGPWAFYKIAESSHGHGGAAVADLDKDGDLDIVWGRDWHENPGDPSQVPWPRHAIAPKWTHETQVAVADLDGDEALDVVLTGEESNHGVAWYRNPGGDAKGVWAKHMVVSGWEGLHSLQVADFDGDADFDILTAEMHTTKQRRVAIIENADLTENKWIPHIISRTGSHKAKVADVDRDGDPDVVGKNFDGDKRPRLWINPNATRPARLAFTHGHRVRIEVGANGVERFDKPVEVKLNFTELLSAAGASGALDRRALHVVEINKDNEVTNEPVPFQFDPCEDYDAKTNATGEFVLLMTGTTPQNDRRRFYVYFDLQVPSVSLPSLPSPPKAVDPISTLPPHPVPSLTYVWDEIPDEDQQCYMVITPEAKYYYHKRGAGFSSWLDKDGYDWISYHPTGGSAGHYRGIPNLVLNQWAHPGYTTSVSQLIHGGPIRARIRSWTPDGKRQLIWDIFPDYARLTIQKNEGVHWFLYEGTPGGVFEEAKDMCVRPGGPEGRVTPCSKSWNGDIAAAPDEPGEWVYFADGKLDRSIFLVHHEDDDLMDQYWPMQQNMTVFGFGRVRSPLQMLMKDVPSHFTIGLCDARDYRTVKKIINSAYRDLSIKIGKPEKSGHVVFF